MLNVLTMCTGDKYSYDYVGKLERAVKRNLSIPHTFECITKTELPGWWGKVELFTRPLGQYLWLDLDVVIVGSIDCLVGTGKQLRCARNWAKSGHGGCQSSVMYWEDARLVFNLFDKADAKWPPSNANGALWGDQEWLTLLRDTHRLEVDYYDAAHVVSYKYHCVGGKPPPDARVVAFHGKPDPHEVKAPFVGNNWW